MRGFSRWRCTHRNYGVSEIGVFLSVWKINCGDARESFEASISSCVILMLVP